MGVYSIDNSFFHDEAIIKSVCRVLSIRLIKRMKVFGRFYDTVKTSNDIDSDGWNGKSLKARLYGNHILLSEECVISLN